jgi:hypothetical protein
MRWSVLLLALFLTACELGKLNGPDPGGPSNQAPGIDLPPDKGPAKVSKSVQLYWSRPLTRANNEPMPEAEIGGYEIRYRKLPDGPFQTIILVANEVQHGLTTDDDAKLYEFAVAVFDQYGDYSDFIVATAK